MKMFIENRFVLCRIADAFLKADNYLTFLPVGNPGEDAGKENKKVYFKY